MWISTNKVIEARHIKKQIEKQNKLAKLIEFRQKMTYILDKQWVQLKQEVQYTRDPEKLEKHEKYANQLLSRLDKQIDELNGKVSGQVYCISLVKNPYLNYAIDLDSQRWTWR